MSHFKNKQGYFSSITINESLEIIRPFNAKVVEGTVVDTQGEIVKGE